MDMCLFGYKPIELIPPQVEELKKEIANVLDGVEIVQDETKVNTSEVVNKINKIIDKVIYEKEI